MVKIKEYLSAAWATLCVVAFALSLMLNIWLFAKHESDIYMMDKTTAERLHDDSLSIAYFDKITNEIKKYK